MSVARRLQALAFAVSLVFGLAMQPTPAAKSNGSTRLMRGSVTASTTAPPTASIYWGVSIAGVPGDDEKLAAWERDVAGRGASIINWGVRWGDGDGWSNLAVNDVRAHGSIPMISWTPEGGSATRWQLRKIVAGEHDDYIRHFAIEAKNWGYPFFLRIMHEMNGAWGYPWQEDANGNQRGEFVQAWRHIIDIFRQAGVTNAAYVWCPNREYPDSPNPKYATLYPGDDYVDWTCLDGYNWGTNRRRGWETFDQVFNYSYIEMLKVAPTKPMMLGEFGSTDQGGSKAEWLSDALTAQIPYRYTGIRAVVYFNRADQGANWRIESSAAASGAWRAGIGSRYYSSNSFAAITGTIAIP